MIISQIVGYWIYDGDSRLKQVTSTAFTTNQYDGLGSARQTTSLAGSVVSSLTTEGFGQALASSGGANTYGFAATSGYRDDGDSGLLHVGARYYMCTLSLDV